MKNQMQTNEIKILELKKCFLAARIEKSQLMGRRVSAGFSLIELMVVAAMIMILSGLLLPAILKAKEKIRSIQCVNNLRQMNFAWTLYAMDYEDRLLPNSPSRPEKKWLKGSFRFGAKNNPDHINTDYLSRSLLSGYLDGISAFKCPSDPTRNIQTIDGREKTMPWVRSVALNQWMAGINNKTYQTFRQLAQIDVPSERFTFVNQRADTLENAYFMTGSVGLLEQDKLRWMEFPERYHNGTTPMAFSDGHVQIKRWETEWPGMSMKYSRPDLRSPRNPDILWFNSRATSLKYPAQY